MTSRYLRPGSMRVLAAVGLVSAGVAINRERVIAQNKNSGVGVVVIKAPRDVGIILWLGQYKVLPNDGGTSNILRHPTGGAELQFERAGQRVSFSPPCMFEVNEIRPITVSVIARGNDLTCNVSGGPQSIAMPVESALHARVAQQANDIRVASADLKKDIQDQVESIIGATELLEARKRLDIIRTNIRRLLDAILDERELRILGGAALKNIHEQIERDTRFTSEQKEFLLTQWDTLLRREEAALRQIGDIREAYAGLLRKLDQGASLIDGYSAGGMKERAAAIMQELVGEISRSNELPVQRLPTK